MLDSKASPTTNVPVLDNGRWTSSATTRWGDVYNPSQGTVIARVPLCTADEAAGVVAAANSALEEWSATPVIERARLMFRYRELLERNLNDLARLITREHGKTLAESRAEIRRGIEVVEFACGIPSLIMGRTAPNLATNIDADIERHPVGVCLGITPFNFPAMVPMWMFPVAIVCGNTFILKPSEKVPLTAVRIGELLTEAGCPPGVFNIVHGDRECVDALINHPSVAAVSFVGSTPVAQSIYQTGTQAGKRVQAAGGAKNHFVIMPDADLKIAVKALAEAAFGCAGQRCMASSIAIAVGPIGDELVEGLCDYATKMRVGPTEDTEEVDMGPVIRRSEQERIASYLDIAQGEGATVALDGRAEFEGDGFLLRPSVIDNVRPEMRVATEEIFGPVLSVIRAQNLDEAIAFNKHSRFGNGASIYTSNGFAAREFQRRSPAGMIGINVGVPAPMAWLPFTGWNQSFYGDLHIQGEEAIDFYTRKKVTMSRWFHPHGDTAGDSIWNSAPSKKT